MFDWVETWKKQGDDMPCPNCGKTELNTEDGITSCYGCGWEAANSVDANTAKIYMVTSFSWECPACGEVNDAESSEESPVTCSECGKTFETTIYVG